MNNLVDKAALIKVLNDPLQMIILVALGLAMGLLISYVYRVTHRGFSYSQSFSVTLLLIVIITSFVIVLIEDSLARAIGIFGAFSIIRFRTAVKDSKDIAFVFFALAAGLSLGTGNIEIGITAVLLICAIIYVLNKINYGNLRRFEYILNFKIESEHYSTEAIKDVFDEYIKEYKLLNVDAKDKGKNLLVTYNLSLKNSDKLNDFLTLINKIPSISDINMLSSKNDLDF